MKEPNIRLNERNWHGYEAFLKADRPNRKTILAEVKPVMEAWFIGGVKYDQYSIITIAAGLAGIKAYSNEPEELYDALNIAQGKIRINILIWKKIPEYVWPELLMTIPAVMLERHKELKAEFNNEVDGPVIKTVYETEDIEPKERAEAVSNSWYELQSYNLYGSITETYETGYGKFKQPSSIRAVERYLETMQALKNLGLSMPERIEYYARQHSRFQNTEVASLLKSIGVNKSVEAVKKSYQKNKILVQQYFKKI